MRQAFGHGLEIDLGLARAGDAAQQRGGVAPRPLHRPERLGRPGLRRRERLAVPRRVEPRKGRVARRLGLGQGAGRDQAGDDRGGHAGEPRQFARLQPGIAMLVHEVEDPPPRLGHPHRLGPGPVQDPPRGRGIGEAGRPGRHAEQHRQWRQRVVGDPVEEVEHRGRQRLGVDQPPDGTQPGSVEAALARTPDAAHHPARPERHDDQLPEPHPAVRREVVEQADRLGREHADPGAGGEMEGRHRPGLSPSRAGRQRPPSPAGAGLDEAAPASQLEAVGRPPKAPTTRPPVACRGHKDDIA